ncbi:MAG: hypothetical protein JO020_32420 [Chloroflexi bacterium]|nr:hypothetical protein [Chloroflexota bacterium]MBV9898885.1 hypothetical protein [Chloroflexota bacterium]
MHTLVRAFWNIANARAVIGYAPEDESEVNYVDDIRRLLTETCDVGRLG